MGGANLEVFKFGMYIIFPIGMMYYFGTNLDNRFSVPDFWPKADQTHRIPFDKEERVQELDRLKARRLAVRAQRLAAEERGINVEHTEHQEAQAAHPRPDILQATHLVEAGQAGFTKDQRSKSQSSEQFTKPQSSIDNSSREGSWNGVFGWLKS